MGKWNMCPAPSVLEVMCATQVFVDAVERYNYPGSNRDTVIKNALAEVWSMGRMVEASGMTGMDLWSLYASLTE